MGFTMLSQRRILSSVAFTAVILGVAACVVVPGAGAARGGSHTSIVASAARNVAINETATLRPTGPLGHIINERGTVSGTYSGSVEARLVRITNTTGEASITAYINGGSLKAKAITHARAEGATAYFRGTATISGGTGTWAHASGSLSFDGTTDRQNFHTTAELHGTLHV